MPTADPPRARDDEGPYLASTFRVRISGTPSARRAARLAVARVEWGPFPVAAEHTPAQPFGPGDALPARQVLLHRGVTRSATDLAGWWRAERSPKRSAGRTVVVELIEPATGEPLLTWTFRGCRAVQLAHSPLDALSPTILTESLLFDYVDVDVA